MSHHVRFTFFVLHIFSTEIQSIDKYYQTHNLSQIFSLSFGLLRTEVERLELKRTILILCGSTKLLICWNRHHFFFCVFSCDVDYYNQLEVIYLTVVVFYVLIRQWNQLLLRYTFYTRCKYSWPFGIMDWNNIRITSRCFRIGLYWWNFVEICAIYSMWGT